MTPGFLTAWLYRLRHSRRPDPFGGALGERLRADIDPLDRPVPEPRFRSHGRARGHREDGIDVPPQSDFMSQYGQYREGIW